MPQQPTTSSTSIVSPSDHYGVVGSHTANSSLSSAVTLTRPAGAQRIMIQAFTQNVRFTLDGTTPTASTGFRLDVGTYLVIPFTGTAIKIIEETASASVQYQWMK